MGTVASMGVHLDQRRLLTALDMALDDAPDLYPVTLAMALKQVGASLSLHSDGKRTRLAFMESADPDPSPVVAALRNHVRVHGMTDAVTGWLVNGRGH